MEFGLHLPYHVTSDRATILGFCARADNGPFARVCMGERSVYDAPDQFSTLGAAAAVTERVKLQTVVTILPAHPAALIAKRAATIDVLSEGRFELGVGAGVRPDDFAAADAPFERRHARLDEKVRELRRLWNQEPFAPGLPPVGPRPYTQGGPPILAGVGGPRALARVARWADGYLGWSVDGDPEELATTAGAVRAAWDAAGRAAPSMKVSVFFALGRGAHDRLQAGWARYFANEGVGSFAHLLDRLTIHDADAVRRAVAAAHDAGFDGVTFVPIGDSLHEVALLSDVLEPLAP